MADANWDTEETSRIIANDEGFYNMAMELSNRTDDVEEMAVIMEIEMFADIKAYPYSDVDINNIDRTEIATEYMEE